MDTVHAELKKRRSSKKSLFTRACNRAESLILIDGSRADVEKVVLQIDDIAGELDEANEELKEALTSEDEIQAANAYFAEIRSFQQEIKKKIKDYLISRGDDGRSVAGSNISRSSAVTSASVTSQQVRRQAEVAARVKRAAVKQLQEQQALEREEERLEKERRTLEEERRTLEERLEKERRILARKQKLKQVEDAAKLAELEARLHQAAENDLEWERIDDLNDSLCLGDEGLSGDAAAAVTEDVESSPAAATAEVEPLPAVTTARLGSSLAPAAAVAAVAVTPPAPVEAARGRQVSPAGGADRWWTRDGPEGQDRLSSRSTNQRSVPQIQLPRFSGSSTEWPRWIGLFRTLIHNQDHLSDAEKMAHLQSSVTGLARQLIEGMLFDGLHYQTALETLTRRFGREKDIVRANLATVFTAPPVRHMDVAGLEKYHAAVHCAVKVLQNMGFSGDLQSTENLRRAVDKLPAELRRERGKAVVEMEPAHPSMVDFSDWLDKQVRIGLNSDDRPTYSDQQDESRRAGRSRPHHRESRATSPRETRQASVMSAAGPDSRASSAVMTDRQRGAVSAMCACEQHHTTLPTCPAYLAKTEDDRARFVAESGRCFSCLGLGHRSRNCSSVSRCGENGCSGRHHSTLHGSARVVPHHYQSATAAPRLTVAAAAVAAPAGSDKSEARTLLQIVPVRVMGSEERFVDTFALLDSGAQISLCSEDILESLKIDGQTQDLCLDNIEGTGRTRTALKVSLELRPLSRDAADTSVTVDEVWAVPALSVPAPKILSSERSEWAHIEALDIRDVRPDEVKVLLGANVSEAIIQREVRIGKKGQPVAIRTDFGWALSGTVAGLVPPSLQHVMHVQHRDTSMEDEMHSYALVSEDGRTARYRRAICRWLPDSAPVGDAARLGPAGDRSRGPVEATDGRGQNAEERWGQQ